MKFRTALITISGATLLAFTGCSNKLFFTTRTSVGLDVSGTAEIPNKVSLSYNRQELAIVPRKTNGEAHSVFGGFDSDISFWDGSIIKQTFATGDAATLATGGNTNDSSKTANSTNTCSLILLTTSTLGLHLSAGEGQTQPSMLMGYRRVEATYIPIPDPAQEVRPVWADILINTKDSTNTNSPITASFPMISGVRIKQTIATGKAATNLAAQKVPKAVLYEAAGLTAAPSMAETAATEAEIEKRAKALSQDKQIELFQWADKSFPKESQGKLAKAKSISKFVSSLLPMLDADGLQAVRIKIEQLEK